MKENYKYYITILLISLILCSGFSTLNFFALHDGYAHMARTIGTTLSIADGQIIPEIVPNYARGFGYSWNLFYGILFPYLSMLFSMKGVAFLSIFLSGLTMYNFMKDVTKSKKLALLTSIFYICAPYRLTEIYVRFAAGEMLTFIFLPLILHGLYSLFNDKGKKHYLITIGIAGVAYSHSVSLLFILILMVPYILINIKKVFKKEVFIKLCLNALFVVLITSFYTLPLMQSKFSADYGAFMPGAMGTQARMYHHSLSLAQLVNTPPKSGGFSNVFKEGFENEMCLTIGLFIVIPLIFTPFIYKKIPKDKRKDYIFLFVLGLAAAYLTTVHFPWMLMPIEVGIIQFPWRFLVLVVFALSIVSSVNTYLLIENFDIKHIFIILTIVLIYISPMLRQVIGEDVGDIGTLDKDESLYYEVDTFTEDMTRTDTMAYLEYLPLNVLKDRKYMANRAEGVLVLEGKAKILNSNKNGTKMEFEIADVEEGTELELPYIYYIGYNVEINGHKLKPEESKFGFVKVKVNESGIVKVKYTGTNLMKFSAITTVLSIVGFAVYIKRGKHEINT